ncbi:MAG: S1 family peptidase [Actinomycetota bacterium]|nr:S1 family peptidase [Actinomycetota bacterium]
MNPRTLLLVVLALALAAVAAPGTALAAGTLQPGAFVKTDTGECTLNFAYTDGATTYLGTAAHCVSGAGEVARDSDGQPFGEVALRGNPNLLAEDYAFIRVRASELSRVSARVKGSPQFPTGVTRPEDTRLGDTIQLSGFGLPFRLLGLTQERRIALMVRDDDATYQVIGPLLQGDSGGPLVHARTGRALGIVSRLCVGVCTEEGPTVQGVLARAAARGLVLRLLTT